MRRSPVLESFRRYGHGAYTVELGCLLQGKASVANLLNASHWVSGYITGLHSAGLLSQEQWSQAMQEVIRLTHRPDDPPPFSGSITA